MRQSWMRNALLPLVVAACTIAAHAQQTSVALSLYGAFKGTTSGNGTAESPSNSAGGIVELRHISNPLVGYEATYSYNRANDTYTACTVTPLCSTQSVKANAHEVTGDWVVSVHGANLRPFALAGIGSLLNVPDSGQANTQTSTKALFVYGAGLDWTVVPHFGIRFQYRGNLYKAPNMAKLFTSTDRFTRTSEPMIGAYFSF